MLILLNNDRGNKYSDSIDNYDNNKIRNRNNDKNNNHDDDNNSNDKSNDNN